MILDLDDSGRRSRSQDVSLGFGAESREDCRFVLDAGSSRGYFECTCVHKSRSIIAIGVPGAGEGERDGEARSRG